ncbi:MAG: DUF1553 domain-containing protein [Acidobacteria bacterium]|nr:DUF1553 domain-containing protein [Acidobacteriota bacterium]
MTGIRWGGACLYMVGFSALTGWAIRASEQKTVGIADCAFVSDPDRFQRKEVKIRGEVFERAGKLNGRWSRSAVEATVPAAALPVRNFIDQEIFDSLTRAKVPAARVSSDEEFLRRISLDLTGRIPSADEVRAFLADKSGDRRDLLIERLLYSPEFTDRWTMWAGDWLQNTPTVSTAAIQRGINGRNAFFTWIQDAIYSEKSFKDIAYEAVTAAGNNFDPPAGASNFPMSASTTMGPAEDNYDMMLSRTASTFLGMSQYDCILCHNGRGHLDALSAWGVRATRTEAQRMAAFFSRMRFDPFRFQQMPGQPQPFYAGSFNVNDVTTGAYNLGSTFGNRPTRALVGTARTLTPEYRLGGSPSGNNWRGDFAENLVRDPMFARNLVNRLWKQMFTLGLVEPVEGLDAARLDPANRPTAINPNTGEAWTLQATHPALLDRLAREFVDMNYQLRPFLRLLAQSTAYQLSSRYDDAWNPSYVPLFARHYARRLEGEEIHDAIVKATEVLPSYTVGGWSDKVSWAMKLPDPLEPRGNEGNGNVFMNYFFRGNRDAQQRQYSGSIQQQLALMNDGFVNNRLLVGNSPRLRTIAQMTKNEDILNEVYLTFLSRYPTGYEKERGLAFLVRKNTTAALKNEAVEDLAWASINKVEYLFSY